MRRRSVALALAAAGVLALVWYCELVPRLAARHIERLLAEHGFPGAHVEVSRIGLDRARLTGLTLCDGLAVDSVELDAGISVLWRARIHEITLRHPKLSEAAVARLAHLGSGPGPGGASAASLPFDLVRIQDGELALGGARVAVSGTIAPDPSRVSVDLVASSDRLTLGAVELRALRASIRDAGADLRACVSGRVRDARIDAKTDATIEATIEACTTLPRRSDALLALRALDVSSLASGTGWQVRATGTLAWAGELALQRGRITGDAATLHAASGTARNVRLTADVAGSLTGHQLDLRGLAQADRLDVRAGSITATGRTVRVPFDAHLALAGGVLRATPRDPVIASAASLSLAIAGGVVELARPVVSVFEAGRAILVDTGLVDTGLVDAGLAAPGTVETGTVETSLAPPRTVTWRASAARWAGARVRDPAGAFELGAAPRHTARWTAITGAGLVDLGAGELAAHRTRGRWTLDHARAQALGGELVATIAPGRPRDLVVQAQGLDLQRVLASFAHGHAEGSGRLDGELALELTSAGPRIEHASLHARPRGTLRLTDPAWGAHATDPTVRVALRQRIAATLADFDYRELAAVLHPPGVEPDLQITMQGRGRRVAQDLDLVINLRGLRTVARRLPFAQSPRSKP